MKTAVVTAIGSFSADAVIKTLKNHGLYVIGCDIYPEQWVANAQLVDRFFQIPKGTDERGFLSALREICEKWEVDFLIPLTDAEIDTLNDNRSWFERNGVKICVSDKEAIDICRNKFRTFQLLDAHRNELDVNIIPTVCATEISSIETTGFPLICKPSCGRSSQGLKRVHHPTELNMILDSVDRSQYVLQPEIAGTVVAVDLIRDARDVNKTIVYAMPRKELLRTGNGAGTSVRVFYDAALDQQCFKIANLLGVTGCVNFELILAEDGTYYFLECNPRFSGGIAFSCMAGYDFIWNHLKYFDGQDIDPMVSYQECYIARKYMEYLTQLG